MRFVFNQENLKKASQLMAAIAASELITEPKTYINDKHILALADVGKALWGLQNMLDFVFESRLFQNTSDKSLYGSTDIHKYFEKIGPTLEKIISILEHRKNEETVEFNDEEITAAQAMKQLMPLIYEPNVDDSTDSEEADSLWFLTKNRQIACICKGPEDRDEKLKAMGKSWQLTYDHVLRLEDLTLLDENSMLEQPVLFTNRKSTFYLSLYTLNGHLTFLCENSETFIKAMGLKKELPNDEDKQLGRVRYSGGLFFSYAKTPNDICISKEAKFFKGKNINDIDHDVTYGLYTGEVREQKKFNRDQFVNKEMEDHEHRALVQRYMEEGKQQSHSNASSSSSSSSSLVSQQSEAKSKISKPSVSSNAYSLVNSLEVKSNAPLLFGEFDSNSNGVCIRFGDDKLLKKVMEALKQKLPEAEFPTEDKWGGITFSVESCQKRSFSIFLQLFMLGGEQSECHKLARKLHEQVNMLTKSDELLGILLENMPLSIKQFREQTAANCLATFSKFMEENPKFNPKYVSPEVVSSAFNFGT